MTYISLKSINSEEFVFLKYLLRFNDFNTQPLFSKGDKFLYLKEKFISVFKNKNNSKHITH